MEFERTEDGIEEYLKEKADQFRMHPSDSLWSELSAKMHKPRRWPYVLAGALIFGLGIGVGVMIQKSAERTLAGENVPVREMADLRAPQNGKQPNTAFISDGPVESQSRIIENFLLNIPPTQKNSSNRLQPTISTVGHARQDIHAFDRTPSFT